MAAEDDFRQWIDRQTRGSNAADEAVWQQYFSKLVCYARRKLAEMPCRELDEEDVALSAMGSLYRGLQAGRFQTLQTPDDLWRLLLTITSRKACAKRRHHYAQKEGGGRVRGDSVLRRDGTDSSAEEGIADVLSREPTPDLAVMVTDTFRRLLEVLDDETLRQIARLALEGFSTKEIAEKLGCVRRTVERKLERIRKKWSQEDLG